jgi:hypothetical protein
MSLANLTLHEKAKVETGVDKKKADVTKKTKKLHDGGESKALAADTRFFFFNKFERRIFSFMRTLVLSKKWILPLHCVSFADMRSSPPQAPSTGRRRYHRHKGRGTRPSSSPWLAMAAGGG